MHHYQRDLWDHVSNCCVVGAAHVPKETALPPLRIDGWRDGWWVLCCQAMPTSEDADQSSMSVYHCKCHQMMKSIFTRQCLQRGKVLKCGAPFQIDPFFFLSWLYRAFFFGWKWSHFTCNFRQEMCSGRCTARCFLPRAVELGGSEEGHTDFIELDWMDSIWSSKHLTW